MNKIKSALFIILFLPQIISAQDCKSYVTIESDNSDLLIFVNDIYEGNGKVELELFVGKYIIKIKEPGFRWDARSIEKEISVDECGSNYDFKINLGKEYILNTNPSDASVFNSDSLIGYTPIYIPDDIKTILIKKDNFKPRRINITELPSLKPVSLDFTGEIKNKSFAESPYFEILVGTALGIGAVAAYYKIQADQSFDQYEKTKDQKYLDETNRYDNYSGIAFAALQINFGTLIYFLLSDQ
ncbi:MAG: hypothetical protein KJ571_19055 [Bacteroidetes bacterium]|nr:hypothetical protein [Bacteroidota bacterium]